MKNLILIAAPAAGKGTQAALLKTKYNLTHISTGDLLREEVHSKSKLGIMLDEIMKSGKLVSDSIVIDLLTKKINSNDCCNGYILDGFPRNINQAKQLDNILKKVNKKINHVIYLDVPYDIAMKRACGRMQCKKCGKVYNKFIDNLKPNDNLICTCGGEIYQRSDDNEDSFKKRYDIFTENTKPLINYYTKENLLSTVDSSKPLEKVFSDIEEIIVEE